MNDVQNLDHPCSRCAFSDASIWANLSDHSVPDLLTAFERRTFAPGETVFRQGEPSAGLYCVSTGAFALRTMQEDGATTMIRIAYPGTLIGFRSFLRQDLHQTEASALMNGRICFVPIHSAQGIAVRNPSVIGRLTERCLDEIDALRVALVETTLLSKRQKLLRILLDFVQRSGEIEGDHAVVKLPVSRAELSHLVGVTPESISRMIKYFRKEGIAHLTGRHVMVPSISVARLACFPQV